MGSRGARHGAGGDKGPTTVLPRGFLHKLAVTSRVKEIPPK